MFDRACTSSAWLRDGYTGYSSILKLTSYDSSQGAEHIDIRCTEHESACKAHNSEQQISHRATMDTTAAQVTRPPPWQPLPKAASLKKGSLSGVATLKGSVQGSMEYPWCGGDASHHRLHARHNTGVMLWKHPLDSCTKNPDCTGLSKLQGFQGGVRDFAQTPEWGVAQGWNVNVAVYHAHNTIRHPS